MIPDMFAGPGGWDLALRSLGRDDLIGLELDKETVNTRLAAGLATRAGDIREVDPFDYAGAEGVIASPPCQTFSAAGKQMGLSDIRGQLVFEVIKWVRALEPAWVACEEVKEVLPIWRMFAEELRGMGYHAWAGILNAADYGVPQSRLRAFLMASRAPFNLPEATHGEAHGEGLFGTVKPWVTMAEALNLPDDMKDGLNDWAWTRPATTVVRSFRPDVIAAPGYRQAGDGPRQNAPGSITVTLDQMARLQCIPEWFPIRTAPSKTKRQSIVGAFLPPPMAAAVLKPLLAANGGLRVCRTCGNDLAADSLTACLGCMGAVA